MVQILIKVKITSKTREESEERKDRGHIGRKKAGREGGKTGKSEERRGGEREEKKNDRTERGRKKCGRMKGGRIRERE